MSKNMLKLIGSILVLMVMLAFASITFTYAYTHPEKTSTQRSIDLFNGTLWRWLVK